jgi:hypothetical protein
MIYDKDGNVEVEEPEITVKLNLESVEAKVSPDCRRGPGR